MIHFVCMLFFTLGIYDIGNSATLAQLQKIIAVQAAEIAQLKKPIRFQTKIVTDTAIQSAKANLIQFENLDTNMVYRLSLRLGRVARTKGGPNKNAEIHIYDGETIIAAIGLSNGGGSPSSPEILSGYSTSFVFQPATSKVEFRSEIMEGVLFGKGNIPLLSATLEELPRHKPSTNF